jgi:hypothetical protein
VIGLAIFHGVELSVLIPRGKCWNERGNIAIDALERGIESLVKVDMK